MGQLCFLVGKSGMGKSTAGRNLNPEETLWINTDQKALPFKKFMEKYNEAKGNYVKSSDIASVMEYLKQAHKNPKIKTVIVDTWSRIMTDAVMSPAFRQSKGFEKWGKFSSSQYDMINTINEKLRDDIIVYLICHPETHYDEDGFARERISVQGKQLEKFCPESFSSIVLYSDIVKSPGKPNRYVFRTVNSGTNTCKTPMEMFDEEMIDNDLTLVNSAIVDYYGI
jgi:hypothetical protein